MSACVIYGAGLLGCQVASAMRSHAPERVILGFVDDFLPAGKDVVPGLRSLGPLEAAGAGTAILFAIGYRDMAARLEALDRVMAQGRPLTGFIHPRASLEPDAVVDRSVVALAGAVVDMGARVEAGAFLDIGARVCERAEIGRGSYLAAGSVVGGSTRLGSACFLGLNATVADGLTLGERVSVQAACLLHRDVADGGQVMEARTVRVVEAAPEEGSNAAPGVALAG